MLDHDFLVLKLYFGLGMGASCLCLYLGNSSRVRIRRASRLRVRGRHLAWICMKNATLPAVNPSLPLCVSSVSSGTGFVVFEIGDVDWGARSRFPFTLSSLQIHFSRALQHRLHLR